MFLHAFIQRSTPFWITSAPDLYVYGAGLRTVSKRSILFVKDDCYLRGPHTLRKIVSTFDLKAFFLHIERRLFSTSLFVGIAICDSLIDVSMIRCVLVASIRTCVRLVRFCTRLF